MNRTSYLFLVLSIILSFNSSAQKIVLQLDATPSTTPSVSKAALRYNKDFAYSFTLDDCSADHYTIAKPFFHGGSVPTTNFTSTGLFSTDGCGNNIVFKPGLAWNSSNFGGYGTVTNDETAMSWTQLQDVYNLGWDVMNHSYSHRSWANITGSYTYSNQITQNSDAIRSHLGIEMPLFIAPDSDPGYNDVAFSMGCKAVCNGNFATADLPSLSFQGIPVDATINTTNYKIFRRELNIELTRDPLLLNTIANKSINGAHYWYTEFTHRIDGSSPTLTFNQFKDYMLNLSNTYGKNGSDRVWFAPIQEVFEYIVSRQNATFTTNLTADNKLEITLNLAAVPTWMRRKTMTLLVNSTANFSNVTLPQGITATWKGTGSVKLLNLDFTNYSTQIPVELLNFTGVAKGTVTHLTWETASERRFKGFEIERSLDGKEYAPIGFVKAKGDGSKYVFDEEKLSKTSYYRLKMVDDDNSFDYSRVVSVLIESKYKVNITPSVQDESVTIETDFEDSKAGKIEVFSQSGKLMLEKPVTRSAVVSLQTLPQGIYIIRVKQGQDFWVKKVAKF